MMGIDLKDFPQFSVMLTAESVRVEVSYDGGMLLYHSVESFVQRGAGLSEMREE